MSYYCTDGRSLYCQGSWGRDDLPREPGGACYACHQLADRNLERGDLPAPWWAHLAERFAEAWDSLVGSLSIR